MGRIELPTYSLPWSCSTPELHRRSPSKEGPSNPIVSGGFLQTLARGIDIHPAPVICPKGALCLWSTYHKLVSTHHEPHESDEPLQLLAPQNRTGYHHSYRSLVPPWAPRYPWPDGIQHSVAIAPYPLGTCEACEWRLQVLHAGPVIGTYSKTGGHMAAGFCYFSDRISRILLSLSFSMRDKSSWSFSISCFASTLVR